MMRFTSTAPRRPFHQPPGRENARSFAEFATIKGLVCQVTEKAVLLSGEKLNPPVWIPFFRMDASAKVRAMRAERGREIGIQVELEWAMKEGLV